MGAALRSVIVPGWGQLTTTSRWIGRILVFLTGIATIGALTVFLFVEAVHIVAWLADPDVILGIVLANLALLIIRLLSTEHAWRACGGTKWWAAIFLALLVSTPHVAIGWVGIETRGAITSVFSEQVALAAEPPITTTSTSTSTTTTKRWVELSPIVSTAGQYMPD
jgi:hypothetical protein